MKNIIFILFVVITCQPILAQRFTYNGVNYNVTGSITVEVVDNSGATGVVSIPSNVTYNSSTYRVTSITNLAFNHNSALTSVTIGNLVTSIGEEAFLACTGLSSVIIPNSVTTIGIRAFRDCTGLKSVTISNALTSINQGTFNNCTSLTSITIPNSVTSIGDYAFFNNSALTSITIPNSVTSIGIGTFQSCPSLKQVTIGNSVTSIGEEAFLACTGLSSVIIPNSVTTAGIRAFRDCTGLKSVTISNALTSISQGTFNNCTSLTSITIPNSVTSIGDYAFFANFALTSVTIPSSVTSIGIGAFQSCSGLKQVTIPASITSIGEYAYENCTSLTAVLCNIQSPLSINSNVFGQVNQGACSLTVPSSGVASYRAAAVWQNFVPITSNTTTYTTSWDYGVPRAAINTVIAEDYTTTGSFTANNLTVNAGKKLTIAAATSVTVVGALANNGTIIVENNANLIQTGGTNTNTGSGTAIVTRNSNSLKRLDYTMWSSPVTGAQTLLQFSPLTSAGTPTRFYSYNPITDVYNSLVPTTTTFTAGSGYLIRMPNEKPGNLGLTTPYYLGNETLSYPGVFTGTLNNGPITLTTVAGRFYAVGNPFPSTISADEFLKGNATAGTLYFWRKTNGTAGAAYASYNLSGGAGTAGIRPNGTIQVGQGFIVIATTTALTFTNAMREAAPTSTQFLKTKNVIDRSRIWLGLSNASGSLNQAMIAYIDGATLGVDPGYDSKYFNDSKIALTSSIEGEEYIIQARPAFDATDVVALIFKTDIAGLYSIALDSFDGVFEKGQDVYLIDNVTGTETDLKTEAYSFTANVGQDNTRFSVKYQKTLKVEIPTFDENSVKVYKNKGTIFVNATSKTIKTIEVYDVQGRLIAKQMNVNATTASITILKEVRQILIVKVRTEDNSVVSKKVLQ